MSTDSPMYVSSMDNQAPAEQWDTWLRHIARQVHDKARARGLWRIEFEDLLQLARIAAWEAWRTIERRGIERRRPNAAEAYMRGAARRACERELRKGKDPLAHAVTWQPLG